MNYSEIIKLKLPWLELNIDIPYRDMYKEAINVSQYLVEHRDQEEIAGRSHKGWSSVCLHGIDWDKTNHFTSYGYSSNEEAPYKWTSISKKCPIITNWFKNVFPIDIYYRIRIMKLDSGGYILPHKDMDINKLSPINIALNQPSECVFKMKQYGVVPFRSGSVMLLDVGNEHAVWNRSAEDRYHIIVHGVPNKKYKELVRISYEKQKISSRNT